MSFNKYKRFFLLPFVFVTNDCPAILIDTVRQTDRQTDRQRGRQIDRQTDRQTDR